MATLPAHFEAGKFSFELVKETVREFDQSKFEYEFEVFNGTRYGFISLWFLPSRPTELKGSISYELRGKLNEAEAGTFCNAIFDFLKTDGLFKTYGFSWGNTME